ncbi:MAG: hypothetical protein AVDCRST_MAG77-4769 [uncultured Chloroflexi bacterium]|uniref:Oligopeptide ABC transporter, periplasmic oligopeptide-binding protein OppA n=1 Tax=uncultured Chloroflexota bacterium TaxID=166587 RepID=A0A6J4JSD2_9CHLR|nr:MAG: hypothetical protein AVDCRST_MAG77-4769 [uncultured Chloroflexota bacterium]
MDDLIAAAGVERDERKRVDMNGRIQELALRDMPILPLYHELAPWAHRDSISGLRHRTIWQPTFDQVRLRG